MPSLPLLEIQEPCPASWESMRGDDRRRFCDHCQRHVHNLSAMPEAEAADLICQSAGRLCVRYEMTEDGKPKTLEYAPVRRGRRARKWIIVGTILSLCIGAANAVWRWTRPVPVVVPVTIQGKFVMGDVAMVQPTTAPTKMGAVAYPGRVTSPPSQNP